MSSRLNGTLVFSFDYLLPIYHTYFGTPRKHLLVKVYSLENINLLKKI